MKKKINNDNENLFKNYSTYAGERKIKLHTITSDVSEEILDQIKFYNEEDSDEGIDRLSREPIVIYINSTGGSITAMFTIIDAIKASQTPIETVNIGMVFKEAFYVFIAAERRYAYPRASFMLSKNIAPFQEDSQSNYPDYMDKCMNELEALTLEKTKISQKDYEERKSEWWMTAETAFSLRVCTDVLRGSYK